MPNQDFSAFSPGEVFTQSSSFLSDFMSGNSGSIASIFIWIIAVILAIVLFNMAKETWLFYRRTQFKKNIEWKLLEIRVPREVNKTPRAMEQFLLTLHGLRNAAGDLLEKYLDGEVTMWWSLEIVSLGGEVHLYIRTPKKHKKLVEAGLYAQYPNVEIEEAMDYMDDFPKSTAEVYQKGYSIFGGEFIQRKKYIYPIITYENFELGKDELAIDPISAFFETLSNIQKEEMVFLQFLIRPADNKWQEEGQKEIDKMLGRESKEEKKPVSKRGGALEWIGNIITAPIEPPTWSGAQKEEKKQEKEKKMSPGEKVIMEAIEKKFMKPGFETLIRYIYYAPKPIFSTNFARRGLLGAMNQYSSPVLNSFRGNPKAETRSRWIYFPHIFVKKRVEARKQRILYNYRNRILPEESSWGKLYTSHPFSLNFPSRSFILNSTELATIYHIPAEQVLTAPHIKRIESKKMGPSVGLPIFVEEEKRSNHE